MSLYSEDFPDNAPAKVKGALVHYAYKQLLSSLLAALLGATLVLIVLYYNGYQRGLFLWYAFFLGVTVLRVIGAKIYFLQETPDKHINLWRNLYIIGAAVGGLAWGLSGWFLLGATSHTEQIIIVVAIALASVWSLTTLSAVLTAVFVFILCALLPFVAGMIYFGETVHKLSAAAFSIFVLFLLLNSVKTHFLIKKSVLLKFKKDSILGDNKFEKKAE